MVQLFDRCSGDGLAGVTRVTPENNPNPLLYETENRVLASAMATRFRKEVAEPYAQSWETICTALGNHFPTAADDPMVWQFRMGMYDNTILTVFSELDLEYDDSYEEEVLDALEQVERPSTYSSPVSLLGLAATKRKGVYSFDADELRARTARALTDYIQELRISSPILTARIAIRPGLIERRLQLLENSSSLGLEKEQWPDEDESPEASLKRLQRLAFRNDQATAFERYDELEKWCLTEPRKRSGVADLQALAAILSNRATVHLSELVEQDG